MEFIKSNTLDPKVYQNYLNDLGDYSFYHTQYVLDYYSKSTTTVDLSFFCMERGLVCGFASLGLHLEKNNITFHMSCHMPIVKKNIIGRERKKILKKIFNEIYKIIFKNDIECYNFFYHPVVFKGDNSSVDLDDDIRIDYKNSFQFLNFFDVETVTINVNLMDLREKENIFNKRLYRVLNNEIHNVKNKVIHFKSINNINSTKDEIKKNFLNYKDFHFKSAGRLTRPENSWSSMLQLLQDGKATLFTLQHEDVFLSYLLCFEHKKYAMCASQTSTTNKKLLQKFELRHFIEQKTIEYYKERGFFFYEIGQSYFFDKDFKKTEDKHKRIGLNKLKYGSDLFPVHYFKFTKKNKSIFDNEHKFIVENEF